jgi:hypothetical protein
MKHTSNCKKRPTPEPFLMIICFEQPDLDDTLLLRFPWVSPTSRGVTQATSAEQFPARHLWCVLAEDRRHPARSSPSHLLQAMQGRPGAPQPQAFGPAHGLLWCASQIQPVPSHLPHQHRLVRKLTIMRAQQVLNWWVPETRRFRSLCRFRPPSGGGDRQALFR